MLDDVLKFNVIKVNEVYLMFKCWIKMCNKSLTYEYPADIQV